MIKFLCVSLIAVFLVTLSFPAFAAIRQVQNLSFYDVERILARLANWMFIILLSVAVIMIIWAAFTYLTAEGESEKISTAHKILIYALVAIGIGILSKGFAYLVSELTY